MKPRWLWADFCVGRKQTCVATCLARRRFSCGVESDLRVSQGLGGDAEFISQIKSPHRELQMYEREPTGLIGPVHELDHQLQFKGAFTPKGAATERAVFVEFQATKTKGFGAIIKVKKYSIGSR